MPPSLRLECLLYPIDTQDRGYRYTIVSRGVPQHCVERAMARMAAVATDERLQHTGHLRLHLLSDDAPAALADCGHLAAAHIHWEHLALWRIGLQASDAILLDPCPAPHGLEPERALSIEAPGPIAQVYEDVLLACILPLCGPVGLPGVDWADMRTIAAGGSHAKLVATSLPAPSSLEELVRTHVRQLREAGVGTARAICCVQIQPPPASLRAHNEVIRAVIGETADSSTIIHTLVPMERPEGPRIVSLLVFGRPLHQPESVDFEQ